MGGGAGGDGWGGGWWSGAAEGMEDAAQHMGDDDADDQEAMLAAMGARSLETGKVGRIHTPRYLHTSFAPGVRWGRAAVKAA